MSKRLNELMTDYVAAFGDYPTISGLSAPQAEALMEAALESGKAISDVPLGPKDAEV